MNGKGSTPRNCFSHSFKDNYDHINWKTTKMKIGIIFCAFNTREYLDNSLAPWIDFRENPPKDVEFFIHALSVPFNNFKLDGEEDDGTQAALKVYLEYGNIDNLTLRDFDQPMLETEARTIALKNLMNKGMDIIWQVDSDEFYTKEEILRIIKFINDRPTVLWFKGSLKNYIFTDKKYLSDAFNPPRIYRTVQPHMASAYKFYDDNSIMYKCIGIDKELPDISAPHVTIPKSVAWTKHLTWLNDKRSHKKVLYQQARGWNCSFAWDDKQGLIWNPNMIPSDLVTEE